jgi:hypothetical protein
VTGQNRKMLNGEMNGYNHFFNHFFARKKEDLKKVKM